MVYRCDALAMAVHGTSSPYYARLLGQTAFAQIARIPLPTIICSALAAGAGGPAIMACAEAVKSGLYRQIHLVLS